MDTATYDLMLTALATWSLLAVAGIGLVALPWTARESEASAEAWTGAAAVAYQMATHLVRAPRAAVFLARVRSTA